MPASAPTTMNLNSPPLSIMAYCGSSILMTVSNKYCVNGTGWNLSFFLLAVQVRFPREHMWRIQGWTPR
jgi:GDP-mannose transporter